MALRVGTIALVGRPNAGKSSLLNALVGERIAAVSPRPQTTRNRVVGILTTETMQAVLLDTPGIHPAWTPLNERMVAAAEKALEEVDAACWIVDATVGWDAELATRLRGMPVVVALNKIDVIPRDRLLPLMEAFREFDAIVPVSAKRGEGLDVLRAEWAKVLPEGDAHYPEDIVTDQPERFVVAEIVREQVFHLTTEEVPYAAAVEIERFDESLRETEGRVHIHARIVVEKPSQKAIVIGKGGQMIKKIGTRARERIESLLGCHVRLDLFVAVERDWTRNPRLLREFGYE